MGPHDISGKTAKNRFTFEGEAAMYFLSLNKNSRGKNCAFPKIGEKPPNHPF